MAALVPADVVAQAAAAASAYLRLENSDVAIGAIAAAAIEIGEAFVGQAFVVRTFEDVVPADGGWQRLHTGPVRAIAGLTALPTAAAPFVLPFDGYGIDIAPDGSGWVRVFAPAAAAQVAVSYSAGMAASWDLLPAGLVQGVAMLAAHLYDDREGGMPPAAVAALWRPYRRMRLRERRA